MVFCRITALAAPHLLKRRPVFRFGLTPAHGFFPYGDRGGGEEHASWGLNKKDWWNFINIVTIFANYG
jgi:hypothetical protein